VAGCFVPVVEFHERARDAPISGFGSIYCLAYGSVRELSALVLAIPVELIQDQLKLCCSRLSD